MTEEIFLAPAEAILNVDAAAKLEVCSQLQHDARVVPFTGVTYDIEDYHVVDGFPVADTALGIGVPVIVEVGELLAAASVSEILAADVGATSRWLPVLGSFDDPEVWAAAAGGGRMDLFTDTTTPELDTSYEYSRGPFLVPGSALRLSGDDYLYTDGVRWTSPSVAIAVVAVLHTPSLDAYGVLETYSADGSNPNRPYVSLRYTRDGAVQTHSLGLQDDRQTSSQGVRTGQPVIVALRLAQGGVGATVVVDRAITVVELHLDGDHPYDARLFVGRSPSLAQGNATMDILEVDYFEDVSTDELLDALSILDGLYGVSA